MDEWTKLRGKYDRDGRPDEEKDGQEDEKPRRPMKLLYIVGGFFAVIIGAIVVYSQGADIRVGWLPQAIGPTAEEVTVSSFNPLQFVGARPIDTGTISVVVNGAQVSGDSVSWSEGLVNPGSTVTFVVGEDLGTGGGSITVSLPSGDSIEAQFAC